MKRYNFGLILAWIITLILAAFCIMIFLKINFILDLLIFLNLDIFTYYTAFFILFVAVLFVIPASYTFINLFLTGVLFSFFYSLLIQRYYLYSLIPLGLMIISWISVFLRNPCSFIED